MELQVFKDAIDFIKANDEFSKELTSLAKTILDKGIPGSISSKCRVESLKKGIIKDTKPAEFNDKRVLFFFYVLDFLNNKINNLQSVNDWHYFIKEINTSQHNHIYKKVGYKFFDFVFIIASNLFDVNIPQIIIQNSEQNSRAVRNSYFDILPCVKASNEELIEALFIVSEGIKPEDNYLTLNQSIKTLSKENNQFGYLIIEKSKPQIEKARLFIPFAFIGITEAKGLKSTFPTIVEFLESRNNEYKKIGLRSIFMLHGKNDQPADVEDVLLPILDSIESNGDDSLRAELIFTYGLLIDKLKVSRQKLTDIPAKYPGKDTFFALARIIHMKIEDEIHSQWLQDALILLSNLSNHHIGTYSEINWALYGIIKTHPEIAFKYFENFIREKQNPISTLEAFKQTFSELARSNFELFQKWITVWFNNEIQKFHHAASKVLTVCDRDYDEIMLDEEIINSLTPYDIEFILYKIAGHVYMKEHLESLVYSALSYKGEIKFVKEIVSQLFCFYIVYNYPSSLEYLKKKESTANEVQKEIIKEVQKYYDDLYSSRRKKKPNELNPSPERLQFFIDQLMKPYGTLDNRSPFREASILDMVTKVSIKTGQGFFGRDDHSYGMHNRYNNKSKMGHVSHSFEFPSGEFMDPIGQEYNRFIWRTFKRRKNEIRTR